jgi:DNA-binding NtrC family response regulator
MQQSKPNTISAEGLTFMVVDDEPSVAFLVRRLLEKAGCEVFSEIDSVKASSFIRKKHNVFDVLICDMTMPKVTGETLIAEALKLRPEMPAILMSGNTFKLPDVFRDVPSVALLEKPIEAKNLFDAIRHVLGNDQLFAD